MRKAVESVGKSSPIDFMIPLVLEQIIKPRLADILTVSGIRGHPAGPFHRRTNLEQVAEIRPLLVDNRLVDILFALPAFRRIKMAAAPAAAKVGGTVITLVVAADGAKVSGRTAAAPAEKTIGGHRRNLPCSDSAGSALTNIVRPKMSAARPFT